MTINKTIDYYNKKSEEYTQKAFSLDTFSIMKDFLYYLPENAHILDAGCGPGRDVLVFKNLGYKVTGMDASEEMVKIARQKTQCPIVQKRFDQMNWINNFEGIWCMASLLHLEDDELKVALANIKKALKNNGVVYASFKEGEDDFCDKENRLFNCQTQDSVRTLFKSAGFDDIEVRLTVDLRNRDDVRWINVIAFKSTD